MGPIVYDDVDEFASRLGGLEGRFLNLSRAHSDWSIKSVHVEGVTLQLVQVGARTVFLGTGRDKIATLLIPADNGQRWSGRKLTQHSCIYLPTKMSLTLSTSGVAHWISISLPDNHPRYNSMKVRHLRAGDSTRIICDATSFFKLRGLLVRSLTLESNMIATNLRPSSLMDEVCVAVQGVLEPGRAAKQDLASRRLERTKILARCLSALVLRGGKAISVEDLRKAADCDEKTLESTFLSTFGTTPAKLLSVHHLWTIRAALLNAAPEGNTITRVVSKMGVGDLARLAIRCKDLFGETPRTLLQCPPPKTRPTPWVTYAANYFNQQLADLQCSQRLGTG